MNDVEREFVSLAKLVIEDNGINSFSLVLKAVRDLGKHRPDLAAEIQKLFKKNRNDRAHKPSFFSADPIPVDVDSRLELLKREMDIFIAIDPVWPETVKLSLETMIKERQQQTELLQAGLTPARSMLLVGAPGVGKTLSARWLAMKLQRPFYVLDLATVMSSFLGKTGNNIRAALEFAQKTPSILLLDEFDAIAKRRDDPSEVGELKRLVTVLLQAIDEWPAEGILLAATNHPGLLDPAVWRRFDHILEFPMPNEIEVEQFIQRLVAHVKEPLEKQISILKILFHGLSFAEIQKKITATLREAIVQKKSFQSCFDSLVAYILKSADVEKRINVARWLESQGHSQRDISQFTSCSRDTLRERSIGIKVGKQQCI